jgi:hypothetical protein
MSDSMKRRYENIRRELAENMQKKYDRVLPLDEMLLDRWKKADLLGFGEKTSVYENVYIYGKPEVGKNVWVGPFAVLDGSGGLKIGDGCDISCGVMSARWNGQTQSQSVHVILGQQTSVVFDFGFDILALVNGFCRIFTKPIYDLLSSIGLSATTLDYLLLEEPVLTILGSGIILIILLASLRKRGPLILIPRPGQAR